MSEEQTGKVDDNIPEDVDPEYEGWLTVDQVSEITGLTRTSISRKAAKEGTFERVRSGHRYLYNPASLSEYQHPTKVMPDLNQAAVVATSGTMRALTDLVPVLIQKNLDMFAQYQAATTTLVEQLTTRCNLLEETNTKMIMTREAYLDGKAERDIAIQESQWSMSQKERVIAGVMKNGPALIELLSLLLSKDEPSDDSEPVETTAEVVNNGD